MATSTVFLSAILVVFTVLFPFPLFAAAPYEMRISCGALEDVTDPRTNILWHKDFGYTGGIAATASRLSSICPSLHTARYFPQAFGLTNCYMIDGVPSGHYWVRIFFGVVEEQKSIVDEPIFDVYVERTLIRSLKFGWTKYLSQELDHVFAEALVFITDGTASICFQSNGNVTKDPAILSIEILQVDAKAYYYGQHFSEGIIFKTTKRVLFGFEKSMFDRNYIRDPWGGDRFWMSNASLIQQSFGFLSTTNKIKNTLTPPNFYPEGLYASALVSNDNSLALEYEIEVDPNRSYSIWFHFAELDESMLSVGQRLFDILVNRNVIFEDVDIIQMTGDAYTALVLNATIFVNTNYLTIILQPKKGSYVMINAIEVFEVVVTSSMVSPKKESAFLRLKEALRTHKAIALGLLLLVLLSVIAIGYYVFRPRFHLHCL